LLEPDEGKWRKMRGKDDFEVWTHLGDGIEGIGDFLWRANDGDDKGLYWKAFGSGSSLLRRRCT
jgi:hypothetical protein